MTPDTNNGRASAAGRQVRRRAAAPGKAGRKPVVTRIPLFRPTIHRRQMHAVLECLVSEDIGPGPIAKQLTGELASALDCRGGLALADYQAAAAAALHLAAETSAGDADAADGGPRTVLLSALVPLTYVYAARGAGLHPLLVDVDPETGSLDAESLQRMLVHRPCALVIGHALGVSEPLEEVRAAGVPIVEDVSAVLPGMVPEPAGQAPGSVPGGAVDGAADGAADEAPDQQPESPPVRAPAGDVLVIGMQAPGVLVAGGGLTLARSARGRRLLAGCRARFGWAELADVNAALALAQWRDLAAGRRRCADLAGRFRDAVARSRHRTLALVAAPATLFPVVVEDGLRAVQGYATRHHVEARLGCEGSAITGLLPAEGDPADGGQSSAAPAPADPPSGAAAEERLAGAQELARRCLLFPLYPELRDAQAGQVARVLASLP